MADNDIRLVGPGEPSQIDNLISLLRAATEAHNSSGLSESLLLGLPLTGSQWHTILSALERTNPRPARETIRRLERELGVRGRAGVFREALRLAREAQSEAGGPLDIYGRTEQPRAPNPEPQSSHTDILLAAYLSWIQERPGEFRFSVEPLDAFQAGYLTALDGGPPPEATPSMVAAGESAASVYIGRPTDDDGIPLVWRRMYEAWINESEKRNG